MILRLFLQYNILKISEKDYRKDSSESFLKNTLEKTDSIIRIIKFYRIQDCDILVKEKRQRCHRQEKKEEILMKFEFLEILMNPFMLMFIAIATGLLFGKIKFGKFSFGSSGALFTGLVIGWAMYKLGNHILEQGEGASGYEAAKTMMDNGIIDGNFLEMSLIFFVAAIGLLAAKDMGVVIKKYGPKFVALAVIITFIGAFGSFGGMRLVESAGTYEFSGVYVGALTSSPGLGAALETAEDHAKEVVYDYENLTEKEKEHVLNIIGDEGLTVDNTPVLTSQQQAAYITNATGGVATGYAIAYPFGVIIVIFAVSFFAIIFRMDLSKEKERYRLEMDEARGNAKIRHIPVSPFDMIAFSIVCVVGYLVGCIQIYLGPLGYFSLGATGGILIMSLVLGCIGKIGPLSFRMDNKVMGIIRDIALVFFLCIVGLRYGYVAINALAGSGVLLAVSALIIGIIAMLVGFIVGRYVFKLNWVVLSGAICGGMTSTPGLGAAVDALESDDPASGYGATYPFALLCMIIFTIILNQLPIV